ncbi:hypothetical protein MTO96_035213 [Rhipicephalus appendiculatus]
MVHWKELCYSLQTGPEVRDEGVPQVPSLRPLQVGIDCCSVGAHLPGLFAYCILDQPSRERRWLRGHERGHSPLLLPAMAGGVVSCVSPSPVDAARTAGVSSLVVLAAYDAVAGAVACLGDVV